MQDKRTGIARWVVCTCNKKWLLSLSSERPPRTKIGALQAQSTLHVYRKSFKISRYIRDYTHLWRRRFSRCSPHHTARKPARPQSSSVRVSEIPTLPLLAADDGVCAWGLWLTGVSAYSKWGNVARLCCRGGAGFGVAKLGYRVGGPTFFRNTPADILQRL